MLMPRVPRVVLVAQTLRSGWWTMRELADLVDCTGSYAWKLTKAVGRQQFVFRQRRRHAFKGPYEYRSFPRAVNVRSR